MPPRPTVVVLGFHRSGTSMVTRMLNLLGVDLGDEGELLPPEERDNARGYWEPRWMIEFNEQLLAAIGSGTFEPFRPEPGWERAAALDPLRGRAQRLLKEHFAGRTLWGWKDPRTSLTLPFWRGVVDGPLRCVVCVRSPADALASILKRNIGINRWTYAERWLDYVAAALEATDPSERMLVFYEDALRDPAVEARRLASFLGLEEPAGDRLAAIAESVEPELRHHRSNALDVAVDPGLPLEARTLYLQLRARRLLEHPDGTVAGQERLEAALEHIGAEQRSAYIASLDAASRAAHAEAVLAERTAELVTAREEVASGREQVATGWEEVATLRAQLEQSSEQLFATERERERLQLEAERWLAMLTTVTTSHSWRLTQPLRTLGRRLRT